MDAMEKINVSACRESNPDSLFVQEAAASSLSYRNSEEEYWKLVRTVYVLEPG
jgi:hypothetical protein